MHLMKSRKNNKKIEKVFQLKTTEKWESFIEWKQIYISTRNTRIMKLY